MMDLPLSLPGPIIPRPVSASAGHGSWSLAGAQAIYVEPGTPEVLALGRYLAERLLPATGRPLPVVGGAAGRLVGDAAGWPVGDAAGRLPAEGLYLTTGGDATLGREGYELSIGARGVVLTASRPAGLFRGIQTLRQLLPPAIEREATAPARSGSWNLPATTIHDAPRFGWRGAMLDVARHFFGVDDVKRFIDAIAYYKMNILHLHLTDDQGWRIAIDAWPDLALRGGSTAIGGDAGGYYSQADYAAIVAHASSRYVTVVPEIDLPGHTHAALASCAELNRDGVAPPLYTGTDVGFSSLDVERESTLRFVDDVLREIAGLTPGPYLHIGGDEAAATDEAAYRAFIKRVQAMVQSYGKQMVGWEEITRCDLPAPYVAQYWLGNLASQTAQQQAQLILSPASRTYLDIKYDAGTPLGLDWAGTIDVRQAYEWDPAALLSDVPERAILGVEAPLWTETLRTLKEVEFMAFPRLPGLAEIGWSPAEGRSWEEYRLRLAAHGPRLAAMGVNFYRSPLVPWKEEI